MAIKPYLQLIRLPNVFTAAADSLAGWLLVGGALGAVGGWPPLALASMAIYAAGIALNDRFDVEIDRQERPSRPLPSGRVGLRFATLLAVVLFAGGFGLAAAFGPSWRSGATAAALILAVVLYDVGLRRTWLGPQVMGLCRGLNVLLGMSLAPAWGGGWVWLVPGAVVVYITGVTWLSRSEAFGGSRLGPSVGLILESASVLGLAFAGLMGRSFPDPSEGREIVPLAGLTLLGLTAFVVIQATGRAVAEPTPRRIQAAVKTGVFALIWLHVGVVWCVRGPIAALAVAALWVPSYVSGRFLYST